jgi:hypothetical protein
METVPLDSIFPDSSFRTIFIDIEGSEISALKGMNNLLEKSEILFIEYIPYHLEYVAAASPEEFSAEIREVF